MKLTNYVFAASVLSVLIFSGTAPAHKINVFAYAENGKIYTESYFPDGRPVVGGKLMVYDSNGNLLIEGATNEQGRYRFEIPKIDDLKIIIEASMGHKSSFLLEESEVEAGK